MRTVNASSCKILIAITAQCWSAPGFTQTYSDRPITLVVPSAPGGGGDILVRALALGGHITWGVGTLGTMAPYLTSGQLRALAVTGDKASLTCPMFRRWKKPA